MPVSIYFSRFRQRGYTYYTYLLLPDQEESIILPAREGEAPVEQVWK